VGYHYEYNAYNSHHKVRVSPQDSNMAALKINMRAVVVQLK